MEVFGIVVLFIWYNGVVKRNAIMMNKYLMVYWVMFTGVNIFANKTK